MPDLHKVLEKACEEYLKVLRNHSKRSSGLMKLEECKLGYLYLYKPDDGSFKSKEDRLRLCIGTREGNKRMLIICSWKTARIGDFDYEEIGPLIKE